MNCLIGAVFIRLRVKNTKIKYRLPTLGSPWGHWYCILEQHGLVYRVWYTSMLPAKDMHWWRQVWFTGQFRHKRLEEG